MQAGAQVAPRLPMDTPDAEPDALAALIARGEHRAALAQCARVHGATLGRLCMALLGSQADADEAVQETLLAAHRAMAGYRAEGTVRAWLCGIARKVCARQLEGRKRRARVVELVPEGAEDPDGAFAVRQRARLVRAAASSSPHATPISRWLRSAT